MQSNKKSSVNSPISNFYLIVYNFLSALGWVYVLVSTIEIALQWKTSADLYTSRNLYENTKVPLKILLATAGLEVFHAYFRLVPSNPIIVFPQVFIRFLVIWAVGDKFEMSTKTIALFMLNMAWSLSEIIRYFYYFFNLINKEFYLLKWSRYNFFIVLYPIGAFAEMVLIYYAAWYVKPYRIRREYSLFLPNQYNISFDLYIFFWCWILLYFPTFPFMYKHMLSQRKKYLHPHTD